MTKKTRLPWHTWLLLLAFCLLGFVLRLGELDDQSLWVDEGSSLCLAGQSLVDILRDPFSTAGACIADPQPPAYYLLLAVFKGLAGESVFVLRLVSVWFGVLGIPLSYVLGKRFFDRRAGIFAALLATFSPYWIWYAQAARPDTLALAAVMVSLIAFHRMATARVKLRRRLVLWVLASLLMLAAHTVTLLVLLVELMALLIWVAARKQRPVTLLAALVLLVAAIPQIPYVGNLQSQLVAYRPAWYVVREFSLLRPQEAEFSLATVLRLLPPLALLLASLFWLLDFPRRSRPWWLLAGLAGVAVASAGLIQSRGGGEHAVAQVVLLLVPAIYVLQGAGVAALWRRSRATGWVLLVGTLLVMGQWLYVQFYTPLYSHNDLQAAARYASQYTEQGDVVLLHNASIRPVWEYYYDGPAAVDEIPGVASYPENEALNRFRAAALAHNRVWFLYSPVPAAEFDPTLLPSYAESQWVKFDQQNFSSAWLEVGLSGYTAGPPVVAVLPAGVQPSDICWRESLCLRGWSATDLVPGGTAEIKLYWEQKTPTDGEAQVRFFMRDSNGQNWAEYSEPLLRYYPLSRWPQNQILEQVVHFPISAAFPSTEFTLALELQQQPQGWIVTADSGKRVNSLGTVVIGRPADPLPADFLHLQYHSDAEFGGQLRLLGYNLPNDTPRPGHTTFIDFYWQVLETPDDNWTQVTRWIDRDNQVWVEQTDPVSLAQMDMRQWQAGDLIQGHVFFPLSGKMPSGEYRIEVSLLSPAGEMIPATEIWRAEPTDRVTAGPAYLDSWPMTSEPPSMPNRPDAVFGNAIRLWGYGIEGEVRPGSELAVTLVWHSELALEGDYRVFLHLMDESGELLGQVDGVPVDWTRPTSSWRLGEFIVDRYVLPIDSEAPAGVAYLWTGMYDPDGSGRLLVQNPAEGQPPDRFLLDILVIEP